MPEPVALPGGGETVRVPGVGRVAVVPDAAVLELGTEARAETVEASLLGAATALTAMVASLRATGITDADVQTTGPSTYPNVDENGRIVSYVCSFRLTVQVSDPARTGVLLAEVVARAGDAARMHGVSYHVSEPAVHERRARAQAVIDARDRAGQLAKLNGRALGRLLAITEVTAGGGGWRTMAAASSSASAAVTEVGVEHIVVTVDATWALGG